MIAVQWIAAVCFAIWGLAHVAFGIFTIIPASQNQLFAVFKGTVGGHPQLSAIEAAFKPLEAAPRGLNALFIQHGCNVLKPGTIACILAFYLIGAGKYEFVTLVATIDIFFDHNFYGIAVDFKGYAEPAANVMLYLANIGVLCEIYFLAFEAKVIAEWIGYLFVTLSALMMAVATVLHAKRILCGKQVEVTKTPGSIVEA